MGPVQHLQQRPLQAAAVAVTPSVGSDASISGHGGSVVGSPPRAAHLAVRVRSAPTPTNVLVMAFHEGSPSLGCRRCVVVEIRRVA
jgi:hypothetical protein